MRFARLNLILKLLSVRKIPKNIVVSNWGCVGEML